MITSLGMLTNVPSNAQATAKCRVRRTFALDSEELRTAGGEMRPETGRSINASAGALPPWRPEG
jgi:hypothetical protein